MRRLIFLTTLAAALLACGAEGPPKPYNLTVSVVSGGAELRWQCPGAADRFLIERSDGSEVNFREIAWTRGDQLFYRDDDVFVNQWYFYQVSAFYENWNGETDVLSSPCPYQAIEIK